MRLLLAESIWQGSAAQCSSITHHAVQKPAHALVFSPHTSISIEDHEPCTSYGFSNDGCSSRLDAMVLGLRFWISRMQFLLYFHFQQQYIVKPYSENLVIIQNPHIGYSKSVKTKFPKLMVNAS